MFKTYTEIVDQEGSTAFFHPVSAILESIETRWAKADQDLFIICLFLNPFIRSSLFNPNTLPMSVLLGIARRLYIRVFKLDGDPPLAFTLQILDYHSRQKQFSDEMWGVDVVRKAYVDEVCTVCNN